MNQSDFTNHLKRYFIDELDMLPRSKGVNYYHSWCLSENFLKSDSGQKLLDNLTSSPKIIEIYKNRQNLYYFLNRIFNRYLFELLNFEFNEKVFNKISETAWKELIRNTIDVVYLVPLANLNVRSKTVDLDNNCALLHIIKNGRVIDLEKQIYEVLGSDDRKMLPPTFEGYLINLFLSCGADAFVYRLVIQKPPNYYAFFQYSADLLKTNEAALTIENAISAMRLFNSECDISYNRILIATASLFSYGPIVNSVHNHILSSSSNYIVDDGNKGKLVEFVRYISKYFASPSLPNIKIGISYYSSAQSKVRVAEKLIDLVTCAEALIVGTGGELRYRLSLRTAFLIGETKTERTEIYKRMKRVYDMRSEIIHGVTNILHVNINKSIESEVKWLKVIMAKVILKLINAHFENRLQTNYAERFEEECFFK